MKTLDVKKITEAIRTWAVQVNTDLPKDVEQALEQGRAQEESPFGIYCFDQILANAKLAREEHQAMCQDTGTMVVYCNVGQDLHLVGSDVTQAINEGVRLGYDEGYLRRSIVEEPVFERTNTGDNTPAVIHYNIVPGDQCELILMPKGGGAENMGALGMLKPTAGREGVIDFVVDAVSKAGGNPCPPIIVGVGIGGTMEKATAIAKEALAREIGSHHADPRYADMEQEILARVNKLGIGPQGLGGRVTALAVHINTYPCRVAASGCQHQLPRSAARAHRARRRGELIMEKHIHVPFVAEELADLRAGDTVMLSGVIYTSRDKAHKRMVETLDRGEALPVDWHDQLIYYAGPTPAKPGQAIGSIGPTTSSRMDAFASRLMDEAGLKGMLGKGPRSQAVCEAITRNGAVYMVAIGGTGAAISKSVKKAEVIAYDDLGTEAVRRLEIENLAAIVAIDAHGGNLFETGRAQYAEIDD